MHKHTHITVHLPDVLIAGGVFLKSKVGLSYLQMHRISQGPEKL